MDGPEVLIPITLFVMIGAVILFAPITRKLGNLLEAMALERKRGEDPVESNRLRETISALESRISLLEERQNFTESLLTSGNHRVAAALPGEADSRIRDPLR